MIGDINASRWHFLQSGGGARVTHGDVTLRVVGDRFELSAPGHAPHSLDIASTDAERLDAHWKGYVRRITGRFEG